MPIFPKRIAPLGLLLGGLFLAGCQDKAASSPTGSPPETRAADSPDAGGTGTGGMPSTPGLDGDRDGDGLPDAVEDSNQNGQVDQGETDPLDADSDDDGLADGVEDSDKDGRLDPGELDPRNRDSDGDGLTDGLEKGATAPVGDPDAEGPARGTEPGAFRPDQDPASTTDPTSADSDGDGVRDGDEDFSRDGRLDPGELDPNAVDSDRDGTPDRDEGVALVCADERLRALTLHALASADLTLALPSEYGEVSILRDPAGQGVGFVFRNSRSGVVGFALSKAPEAVDVQAEKQALRARIDQVARLSNEQDRALVTWDGFPAVVTTASAQRRGASGSALAVEMASEIVGEPLTGGFPATGRGAGEFTAHFETVLRTSSRSIVIGALAEAPTADANLIALADIANGTGVAQFGDFTGVGCDAFRSPPGNDVIDLLWVVDNSCSMAEEQRNVAAAGNAMVALLSTTQLSWRLGLITTDQSDGDLGCCGVDGFTPSAPRAAAEAASSAWAQAVGRLGTRGDGEERGATVALTAAQQALPATAQEDRYKFRQGASVIVVHMSDEEDFTVKQASGGDDRSCPESAGKEARIRELIDGYLALSRDTSIAGFTTFAIHGIQPNASEDACSFDGSADCGGISQHGRSYVDIASALGGGSGSICGDMSQVVQDIIRAGAGIASQTVLRHPPISSTLRVVMADEAGRFTGQPEVPRSRQNGFDYAFELDVASNAVQHKIVFYGAARPSRDRDLLISYRTWQDGSPNPDRPDCDCPAGQRCAGDTNACEPDDPCDGRCGEGERCNPSTETCESACLCAPGEVCDLSIDPPRCVSL